MAFSADGTCTLMFYLKANIPVNECYHTDVGHHFLLEFASEAIGKLGGLQDILADMRAFHDNPVIAACSCSAIWSICVNGELWCRMMLTQSNLV